PIVAAGLFPEMAQQFVPVPIVVFDRARALEASIESAWTRHAKGGLNIFREPFRAHWHPEGNVPMLVLNATVAESGVPVMIAPFRAGRYADEVESQPLRSLYERQDKDPLTPELPPNMDLPLGTAVGLSARYPLVLPAGVLPDKHRLLDGGIFENSGIETI